MKVTIKSLNILPRWVIVSIDVIVILVAVLLVFGLRFDFSYEDLKAENAFGGAAVITSFLAIVLLVSYRVMVYQLFSYFDKNSKQIITTKIEQLLGREPVQINSIHVRKQTTGKIVLITGAAGTIGAEIVRQIVIYKPKIIILLDQNETHLYEIEQELSSINGRFKEVDVVSVIADIRDYNRLDHIFETYRPQVIYHAAAYKHVPMMEKNASEAVKTNVFGTKNLADLAVKYEVTKFVLISTDKAVKPTNVMGASKRIAEVYVQSLSNYLEKQQRSKTVFVTTRFGNVLGSSGSVIPLFKRQIEKNGPVTVTHKDMTRYFMTVSEACQLSLEAGAMAKGKEIFIVEMGKPIKIIDLAEKMIELSGYIPYKEIPIQFTGLRPGEKLAEELLATEENTLPTHHEKIKIAIIREHDYHTLIKDLEELKRRLELGDDFVLVSKMKEIAPDFVSNSSVFEALDLEEKKQELQANHKQE